MKGVQELIKFAAVALELRMEAVDTFFKSFRMYASEFFLTRSDAVAESGASMPSLVGSIRSIGERSAWGDRVSAASACEAMSG